MLNEKRVLGKGLSALILDNPVTDFENGDVSIRLELDLSQIEPNPWQPRGEFLEDDIMELKESILEHGVIQPIIVRKTDEKYQIVAGERRWRASKLAGNTSIPAVIVDYNDDQMLEVALVENIQRQNLNPIEEAKAFKDMMLESEYTQEELAKRLGKSRSYIANSVRLLALPNDVQAKVVSGHLSASHARTLVGNDNASQIASNIVNKKLNVRTAEHMGRNKMDNHIGSVLGHHNDSDLIAVEKALSEALQMSVRIRDTYNGGILSIKFLSLDQLDTLIQSLTGSNLSF